MDVLHIILLHLLHGSLYTSRLAFYLAADTYCDNFQKQDKLALIDS